MATPHPSGGESDRARANITGAYVAIAGVLIFTVSVFLDWATPEGEEAGFGGYEADSLLPFAAFLGIGLCVALLYAASRAYRRQHRGLSLATMAVGLAVALQSLAWILDVPGAAERQSELNADVGSWVGLVGAVVWTIGAAMLANEPEGDPERDRVYDQRERHADDR
jgi:ABC-type Fe3+-siderophore transport system permease subunit